VGKVFDNYYGTPKRQVLNLLKKGVHVLLCIDVKGPAPFWKSFQVRLKFLLKPRPSGFRIPFAQTRF